MHFNPVNYIWAWHQLEYQANKMAAAHAEPLTSMNVGID